MMAVRQNQTGLSGSYSLNMVVEAQPTGDDQETRCAHRINTWLQIAFS
jgi:hypothetical protein